MIFLSAVFATVASVAYAAEELGCPDGTADRMRTDAVETELWCERPDGTRHGPYQRRDTAGKVIERGYYEEGQRSGDWRYYDALGRVVRAGQMSRDRPDGAWTHFEPSGTPTATLTYGVFPPADAAPPQPGDPRHRWQLDLDGTPTAWWTAPGSRMAVAIGTSRLLLVSLQTGAIEADIPLPAPLRPQLRIEANRILGVTGPGELFVVDLHADGGGSWKRIRTPVGVTDVIASGSTDEVWVRSGRGRLAGIDVDSGNTTWSSTLFMDAVPPTHAQDRVIGVRAAREVRAVTAGDGAFAWQARMPARVIGLTATARAILVLMETGGVQALSADTGAPLWEVTVDLRPGVQPELRTGARHAVVSTPHEAWRIDPIQGTLIEHLSARAPEGETAADFSVGDQAACTTGRRGGIRCLPGEWELPTPPLALPPLVAEGTIVIADRSGQLRALEGSMARAIEQTALTNAELLVDDRLLAEVGWMGERLDVELPWVVVERHRPEDSCSITTAAIQLPHPDGIWPQEPTSADTVSRSASPDTAPEPSSDVQLWIDDLVLYDSLGEGSFRVHDDWEEVAAGTTWRMSYWHRHLPTLRELHATIDEATDPAEVDALIRCEGPPARFRGTALLEDGVRAFRITGNLELQPHPHSLDGVPGCLLDVSMAGTDHGAWSSPVLPAWTEIVLEVYGDHPPDALPAEVAVPRQLEGQIQIDAYEAWAVERTTLQIDGVVELDIAPGDHRGPLLRVLRGHERLLEVAVPELVYGAVEEDETGDLMPTPEVDEHVDLSRTLSFHTPAHSWRVLWTRSSCAADLEPSPDTEPSDTSEPALPTPEAGPAPTTRPTPLPPASSRWRKSRSPKPPRDPRRNRED